MGPLAISSVPASKTITPAPVQEGKRKTGEREEKVFFLFAMLNSRLGNQEGESY